VAFEGPIFSNQISVSPGSPTSVMGHKTRVFLSALPCLLSVSGHLLLCFPLGIFSPGLCLNLFPLLGFPVSTCGFLALPPPLGLSGVLQASELGMTSAFYKYILTTMVRIHPSSMPAHHVCAT
jgi:hypothetical protein